MSVDILATQEWYEALVDDCSAILTEKSYESRWALIEMYFMLGERVRFEAEEHKVPISKLVGKLASDLNVVERNVWYAVQAYDKFKSPEKLPEGKNISWTQIKRLLPANSKRDQNLFEAIKVAQRIVDRYGVDSSKEIYRELGIILDGFE